MRYPGRQWACRVVASLGVGLVATLAGLAAPVMLPRPGSSAWADPMADCTTTTGVVVAVEFPDGNVEVSCAADPVGGQDISGWQALVAAGFQPQDVQSEPGFVCRLTDQATQVPEPADQSCVETPPASDYWMYWYASAQTGWGWYYSRLGADSRDPPPGSVDAWIFSTVNGSAQTAPSFPVDQVRAMNAGPAAPSPPPTTAPATTAPPTTARPDTSPSGPAAGTPGAPAAGASIPGASSSGASISGASSSGMANQTAPAASASAAGAGGKPSATPTSTGTTTTTTVPAVQAAGPTGRGHGGRAHPGARRGPTGPAGQTSAGAGDSRGRTGSKTPVRIADVSAGAAASKRHRGSPVALVVGVVTVAVLAGGALAVTRRRRAGAS